MLTAQDVLAAAHARGIFALPTRVGDRGAIHLGSLGIDWAVAENREQLFALIDAGAVEPFTVWSGAEVRASLVARGMDPGWFDDRVVERSATRVYDAILVQAVALSVDAVSAEHIAAMYRAGCDEGVHGNPDVMHAATVAVNAHGDFTRTEQLAAREQVAAFWNRRAGIVTGGPFARNSEVSEGSVVAVDIEHLYGRGAVPYYAVVRSRTERSAVLDYAAGTRGDKVPIRRARLVTDPRELAEATEELARAGLLSRGVP